MSNNEYVSLYEDHSVRITGFFEPECIEFIEIPPPQLEKTHPKTAYIRLPTGERIRAWCIQEAFPLDKLNSVVCLDGFTRFIGPYFSTVPPDDKTVVMGHLAKGRYNFGSELYIIAPRYKDLCGLYDTKFLGYSVDLEDEAERIEALHHQKERAQLQQELEDSEIERKFLRSGLSSQQSYIEELYEEMERLGDMLGNLMSPNTSGTFTTQYEMDLSVLGLTHTGFDNLDSTSKARIIMAMERELHRSLHPDLFNDPSVNTEQLQSVLTQIIQIKIDAIRRLKTRK